MSLETRLLALIDGIAAQIKALKTGQGTLAGLNTTAKTNLVAAINEVLAAVGSGGGGGASILDTAGSGDTTHTWSADKIVAAIAQAKSDLIAGAPAALDTLLEIANKLSSDDTALAGLLTAVANRVDYSAAQSLTTAQQIQACQNIGVGDPTTDLLARFNAGLA